MQDLPRRRVKGPIFGTVLLCLFNAALWGQYAYATITGTAINFLMAQFFLVFALTMGFAISLSFESFTRYSRYGVSNNRKILNHVLSVGAIVISFAAVGVPFLTAAASGLMAYSKFKSPDHPDDRSLPFTQRQGWRDFLNMWLWIALWVAVVLCQLN